MYLLFAVIEKEDILDDLITGRMEQGVSGSTVIENSGALHLCAHHIRIFVC